MDTALALGRLCGDEGLYRRLLREFRHSAPAFLDGIGRRLAEGDRVTARQEAHNLKSFAGNVGATRLQLATGQLEALLAQDGGTEPAAFALAEVGRQMLATLEAFAGMDLDPPAEPAGPARSGESAAVLLTALLAAVSEDDTSALDIADRLAAMLGERGPATPMNHIRECLRRYDFTGARTVAEQAADELASACRSG
ncbi:MAG: Hpt domain-containing protein [Magnetospirillum sp.]|nr:Hpt domain-containing protein [Magnetospirillum sp.]